MTRKIRLKIYRGVPGKQYWETFELELTPAMNVISALMEIRRNPVNIKGERVAPVVWQDGCLEEVCGSCSMLVNGYPCQACSCVLEPLLKKTGKDEVQLAPFTKFPLVRDLMVDRTRMFENLKKVRAWIESDGSHDTGPGPKVSQKKQALQYAISKCMTCGCCTEGCPQVNKRSKFMGPAPIAQVRLFNSHPQGVAHRRERLRGLMGVDGLNQCGNAQNCEKVCPKGVPLLDSIASMGRDLVMESWREFFSFRDRDS